MSIRRKLFLAFTLVAAISSAALLLLARSYIESTRAQLDRRFVDDARAALARQHEAALDRPEAAQQVVSDFAADPDILRATNDAWSDDGFVGAPTLIQIAVWDASKHKIVRSIARPGAQVTDFGNVDEAAIEARLKDPRIDLDDVPTIVRPIEVEGKDAPLGFVIAEIDERRLCSVATFGHEGQALLIDVASGKPWMDPKSVARVRTTLPGFARLVAKRPGKGESAEVDDGRGRTYRIYSGTAAEAPVQLVDGSLQALVVMPADELYAPLAAIRARVSAGVVGTVLLALLAAFVLSGRFAGDVASIRAALDAFAAGGWHRHVHLSIRRKLFLSFAVVAAIASAALLMLAGSYIGSVRAQLDRRFSDDARAALAHQTQQSELTEKHVIDLVGDSVLDPKMMVSTLRDGANGRILFERMPGLLQLALYENDKLVLLHTSGGLAVDPIEDKDRAALVHGGEDADAEATGEVHPGRRTFVKNNRYFALATTGSERSPRVTVIGEVDFRELFRSSAFGDDGRALLVDFRSGKPWLAPDEVDRVHEKLPGLERLLASRPPNGESIDVDDSHGRRYRVYSAVSAEMSRLSIQEGVVGVALMPLDELYAPLTRIRLRVVVSVAATMLLALLVAFLLSGRFVADVERVRAAVTAFAAGDWRRLEKSSRDELGGALVDSINDMTMKVAERMRRDEAESWRSLVRVVSHEINNTLAPIKSVAASLRAGLPRRLRDDEPAADVDMALKLIVERVDALATFIDGYAEVAKLPPPNRQPTDVNGLIAGATALFAEQAAGREVALDVRQAASGAAEIDPQQIERVLVNVIKNAIEASPPKGTVTVSGARVAGALEISVADDGPGISDEARRNLFVPYFSTKPGGSGIGLALARQIVVAHGGTITAERGSSGGTLMRIVIPDVVHTHPYREVG